MSHSAGTRRGRSGYGRTPMRGSPPGVAMLHDERYNQARRIAEALDPTTAPGKVRTLADMTPEKRAEMAIDLKHMPAEDEKGTDSTEPDYVGDIFCPGDLEPMAEFALMAGKVFADAVRALEEAAAERPKPHE